MYKNKDEKKEKRKQEEDKLQKEVNTSNLPFKNQIRNKDSLTRLTKPNQSIKTNKTHKNNTHKNPGKKSFIKRTTITTTKTAGIITEQLCYINKPFFWGTMS